MQIRTKILFITSAAILVATLFLYSYASFFMWNYTRANRMPVQEEFYLQDGEKVSVPFKSNWTSNYSILLKLRAKTPEQLKSLINAEQFQINCEVFRNDQKVSMEKIASDILSNNKLPFIGSRDKYTFIRGENRFQLKSGFGYKLVAEVHGGSEVLDDLRTVISVYSGQGLPKGHWALLFCGPHRILWMLPSIIFLLFAVVISYCSKQKEKPLKE